MRPLHPMATTRSRGALRSHLAASLSDQIYPDERQWLIRMSITSLLASDAPLKTSRWLLQRGDIAVIQSLTIAVRARSSSRMRLRPA